MEQVIFKTKKKRGRKAKGEEIVYDCIYLDDMEFGGQKIKHSTIIELWDKGTDIIDIAQTVEEDIDKTFIILFHLARIGEIKTRGKQGIWGDLI